MNIQTGNEKKKCHCGAKNCSSFLGVRPKNQIQDEKPKKAGDKRKKKKIKKPVVKEGMCAKFTMYVKRDFEMWIMTKQSLQSNHNQDETGMLLCKAIKIHVVKQ